MKVGWSIDGIRGMYGVGPATYDDYHIPRVR